LLIVIIITIIMGGSDMAEANFQLYATREDLVQLEVRMGQMEDRLVDRIGQMETRLTQRIGEQQIAAIKWIAGLLLVHFIGVVGLTVTLIKVMKP
jgi:hypothetical protein